MHPNPGPNSALRKISGASSSVARQFNPHSISSLSFQLYQQDAGLCTISGAFSPHSPVCAAPRQFREPVATRLAESKWSFGAQRRTHIRCCLRADEAACEYRYVLLIPPFLTIVLTALGTIGHVDHGKVQETRDKEEARANRIIFRPH